MSTSGFEAEVAGGLGGLVGSQVDRGLHGQAHGLLGARFVRYDRWQISVAGLFGYLGPARFERSTEPAGWSNGVPDRAGLVRLPAHLVTFDFLPRVGLRLRRATVYGGAGPGLGLRVTRRECFGNLRCRDVSAETGLSGRVTAGVAWNVAGQWSAGGALTYDGFWFPRPHPQLSPRGHALGFVLTVGWGP